MRRSEKAQQEINICRAYRAIMLNEDGSLKPEAEVILRDLEFECGAHKKTMPTIEDGSIDPLRIAENFAKTAVFRHVRERIYMPLDNLVKATER